MYKARLPKLNVRKYGRHRSIGLSRGSAAQAAVQRSIGDASLSQSGALQLPAMNFNHTAAIADLLFPPANLARPLVTPVEIVASNAHQYTETRLQLDDAYHRTAITPQLEEILWQKMYKGLALLEQGVRDEAFRMLNAACDLAEPVLRSRPWLIFRAIFMVFGTSRWQRFPDVWAEIVRYLAAMASVILGRSDPVAVVLRIGSQDASTLHSCAEMTLRHILKCLQARLGPVHPEILRTRRNLAVVLRRQSEPDDGEEIMRQTVTTCEQSLGMTHVETLRCLRRLASLYIHHGRYEDAEGLLIEALRRAGRPDHTVGPITDDTDTFVYANRDLALIAMQQQDMEKCRPRLKQFAWACQNNLSVVPTAIQDPPQDLTIALAEQYIKHIVMAYDLHCDELASRLMSSSVTATVPDTPVTATEPEPSNSAAIATTRA